MSRDVVLGKERPPMPGTAFLLRLKCLSFVEDPTKVEITVFLSWNHSASHSFIIQTFLKALQVPGLMLGTGVMRRNQARVLPSRACRAVGNRTSHIEVVSQRFGKVGAQRRELAWGSQGELHGEGGI